jgi:hypothetical protein
MLAATPVRNEAARCERLADGSLDVRVPRALKRLARPPLAWLFPVRPERHIVLDPLGATVWEACDGLRTVEAIVDGFAAAQGLSFHEARVAVTKYLTDLIRRGVLAIRLAEDDGTAR